LERGNQHHANQEYDQAAYYWNPLANAGNSAAQFNVGLLWEYGLGSTPLNTAQASQWYLLSAQQGYPEAMVRLAHTQILAGYNETAYGWLHLASRWGNQNAINQLIALGRPVPSTDLIAQQGKSDFAENMSILADIVNAFNGTSSNSGSSSYTPSRSTSYSNSTNSNSNGYRGPSGQRYQYDLSKPGDQIRYETDPAAQLRDELNVDPRQEVDEYMGVSGGGVQR